MSVDVYSTKEPAEQANQELVDSFLKALQRQTDPQSGDVQQMQLAGEEGPGVAYAFTDKDGVQVTGLLIAVTSPRTGLSYLVSVQAPKDEFDTRTAAFQAVLDTFRID